MNTFSASEAGLEGFRITRENPRAFLRWIFFSFVVSALGAVVTVMMPAEVRDALTTLGGQETPSTTKFFEALIAVAPLVLFGLAFQCVMAAAVYRIILRHDEGRFGYLRLGADELRLMALTFIYLFLAIVLLVAVTIVAAVITAVASFAGTQIAVLIGVIVEVFSLGLLVFVGVRLSLAPVATFAERRLSIFESWGLTRGYFWRLFGAYVLAVLCMFVVALLTLVLFTAVAGAILLATGGQLSDLSVIFTPDETSFRSYIHPAMVAYMVVGSVVTALYYAVIASPGAVVYRYFHDGVPIHPLSPQVQSS
jgi:hypothetical protein